MRTGFRIVPKMVSPSVCVFVILLRNGECRQIAEVHFPNDGQMNDNCRASEAICEALRKRVRQSV